MGLILEIVDKVTLITQKKLESTGGSLQEILDTEIKEALEGGQVLEDSND